MRSVVHFFDKFEDRIRTQLSKSPLIYALIGGAALVLFWRGVWGIADRIPLLSNPFISLLLSLVVLLSIGLFVSFFVGDSIILSGLRGEKKFIEKALDEVAKEVADISVIKEDLKTIKKTVAEIKDRQVN